jgi:hypothetical protein
MACNLHGNVTTSNENSELTVGYPEMTASGDVVGVPGQLDRPGGASEMVSGRYRADITAGSLKIAESRVIADLLLRRVDEVGWKQAMGKENPLKARNPATAIRLGRLIRQRLETMTPELWQMVRDGTLVAATHAVLAAAIKHSSLLGDFLDMAVRDQYRRFGEVLTKKLWFDFLEDCRGRDPQMPQWHESTTRRMGSSVFQILAQAGYIRDTRSMLLLRPHITTEVIGYLKLNEEDYVLRCITVGT